MPHITVAKIILSGLSVFAFSQTALAACAPGASCTSWAEAPAASTAPIIEPLSLPSTVTVAQVSKMRIPGLAPSERLCPATCPVSVKTVPGGKVKACFKVCTPVSSAEAAYGGGAMASGTNVSGASSTSTSAHTSASGEVYASNVQHTVIYEPFEVKPVVKHHYVRVIRPVIYVHYPVPVAPPCRMNCKPSRYGY